MENVNIEYLRIVTSPARLAGRPGERKAVPVRDARRLVAEGFASIVPPPTEALAAEAAPEACDE